MNSEQLNKLERWEGVLKELAIAKLSEIKLRKELSEELFVNPKLGVNSIPLLNDWVLKLTVKESKSINQEALKAVIDQLSVIAADKAVKVTYGINYKAFDFISNEDIALLESAIVTKPAAPTLKIVKPKI